MRGVRVLIFLSLALYLSACVGFSNTGSNVVSAIKTVSNGGLTVELMFMGQLELEDGNAEPWSMARQQPYIKAAKQWLSALKGVEGKTSHKISMRINVQYLEEGNGVAGPDEEEVVGVYSFPTEGEMIIGNHTYVEGFDSVEFYANIMHEMGHIFGIGTVTEDYTHRSKKYGGIVFAAEKSEAVKKYNALYDTNFTTLPFGDDGGHLYDHVLSEDRPRVLRNGQAVPPMTKELMANGSTFGVIALAVLDDIGYLVDYSVAEKYIP